MKKSKLISMLLVMAGIAMIMTGGLSVFAASDTATQGLRFTNPATVTLTFTGSEVNFGTITPGVASEALDAASVGAQSNAVWSLTLTGTDFISGANTILLDDCFQARAGTTAYANIGTGLAIAANHTATPETFVMDYQLTVPVGTPGTATEYQASLTYTLFNP